MSQQPSIAKGKQMNDATIEIETRGRVGIVRLNRPEALNALNEALMTDLSQAIFAFDSSEAIACMILTGSPQAFAAGADIKEMAGKSYPEALIADFAANWTAVARARKPVIAAVAGYALGGGCELAMMCDVIIAADNAKFGQPEIKLGVIPGLGGTQRLTRAIGKAKAMDLCLTGRVMDATEAKRSGLVARVVPLTELLEEALKLAEVIAGLSLPAIMLVKDSVNRVFEGSLAEGLRFERRASHALLAPADQKEGMAAFVAQRPAKFRNA